MLTSADPLAIPSRSDPPEREEREREKERERERESKLAS